MLNGLSLFSGIGGIDIALSEWVRPVLYCEIDRYAQGVLLSRMAEGKLPRAPIWDDITTLRGGQIVESTSFMEEAPAKISVLQDLARVWAESEAAFSMNSSGLLEKSNQGTFFGKMSGAASAHSTKSLQSLKSLATPQERAALKRHTLEDVTGVKEFGFLPTLGASENKGSSRKRYRHSQEFRGAKMSEGLRRSEEDPIYLHPSFAEQAMMYPLGWTELNALVMQLYPSKRKKLLKD